MYSLVSVLGFICEKTQHVSKWHYRALFCLTFNQD